MKIDETADDKRAPDNPLSVEDSKSRREFLNGLGKWSMIVVATVSFLRETAGERLARRVLKPMPTQEPTHDKYAAHTKSWTDVEPRQKPKGGQPLGPPPTKIYD